MKEKLVLKIGLLFICISLNLFQDTVFSQGRFLLVLDIQDFQKKNPQMDSSVKEMINNVNSLLNYFNAENVIYIKSAMTAISITSKGFSIDTVPVTDFDSTLNIVSSNIFIKTKGNAFTVPELTSFLESKKVRDIVLVGLMADKCIFDTAIGGIEKGYSVSIVPEGIVGTTVKKKDKAIKKMKDKEVKSLPIKSITGAQ